MEIVCLFFVSVVVYGCTPTDTTENISQEIDFNQPVSVKINGYDGNSMEPFLSRDGTILLFNNLNSPPENTNLHWATKVNDTTFYYQGEIAGVNTVDLEGVPTLDSSGNLYFVSNRNYANTLSTIYQSNFSNGIATTIHLPEGVSKLQAGIVNFDVEVSADGNSLYFVDAQFDKTGTPLTADLVIAQKNGSGFKRLANSSELLANINTDALDYAACISANQLELYFTRVVVPFTANSSPEILVSTRKSIQDSFRKPSKIKNITGFAEAPTIAPDQATLYYHKKENDKFVLYMIKKK